MPRDAPPLFILGAAVLAMMGRNDTGSVIRGIEGQAPAEQAAPALPMPALPPATDQTAPADAAPAPADAAPAEPNAQ
ncbi:hypothetical protein D3C83_178200 [compost metagenome]